MGFSFRKSFRLGPLRLNLSKSGIGVSAGAKGARIGTGPHGSYVSAAKDGISYRKALGAGGRRVNGEQPPAFTPIPVKIAVAVLLLLAGVVVMAVALLLAFR